jgi:hypothetical protein
LGARASVDVSVALCLDDYVLSDARRHAVRGPMHLDIVMNAAAANVSVFLATSQEGAAGAVKHLIERIESTLFLPVPL